MMPEGKGADYERLRRRLREVREYLNLSQQFVAQQSGLGRTAIADIERGARNVNSLELQRLAKIYRHPVSYFLDEGAAIVASSETLDALNRAAADLSDEDRAEVLRFAQFLRFYGSTSEKQKT
jgi:transcriptional regulator with XRE-family HTH domain